MRSAHLPKTASGITLLFLALRFFLALRAQRFLLVLPFHAALRVNLSGRLARLCLLPFHFFELAPLQLKDAVAFHLIH